MDERLTFLENRVEELEKKITVPDKDRKLEIKLKEIIKSSEGLTVYELRKNALKIIRREDFSDTETQYLKKGIDSFIETLKIPAH